ncbi:MAG TPA: SLC13 family permease [Gemmatimonadaceae bacterium]|nr:SLC13 family permease [Gemmatimonadaceae bacterium]
MSAAAASLLALLVALAISLGSRVNVGVVAIVFAFLVGTSFAGFSVDQIAAGFPSSLFLTLVGVTLLFGLAEANGTLERLAHLAVRSVRGRARAIPLLFFFAAMALSSVGPGAISTVALFAPLAMAIGTRAGLSPFLVSLMVANGANAGNLSPVSAVGIIANTKMATAGLGHHEAKVWLANFLAHAIAAMVAYAWLTRRTAPMGAVSANESTGVTLAGKHWITVAVVATWIAGVLFLEMPVGPAAFAAAALLVLLRCSDEASALRSIPWGVILMVCGVTVLVALLEKTGGMELFSGLLAALASPATVNGVVALVTGLISSWSSTAGVVLPAFLPAVPGLVSKLGGGDPLAVALSVNVGASMVDVSPLSTLGALCLATVRDPAAARQLFRQLLVWGLAMSAVAALLCQLGAGFLARH